MLLVRRRSIPIKASRLVFIVLSIILNSFICKSYYIYFTDGHASVVRWTYAQKTYEPRSRKLRNRSSCCWQETNSAFIIWSLSTLTCLVPVVWWSFLLTYICELQLRNNELIREENGQMYQENTLYNRFTKFRSWMRYQLPNVNWLLVLYSHRLLFTESQFLVLVRTVSRFPNRITVGKFRTVFDWKSRKKHWCLFLYEDVSNVIE